MTKMNFSCVNCVEGDDTIYKKRIWLVRCVSWISSYVTPVFYVTHEIMIVGREIRTSMPHERCFSVTNSKTITIYVLCYMP